MSFTRWPRGALVEVSDESPLRSLLLLPQAFRNPRLNKEIEEKRSLQDWGMQDRGHKGKHQEKTIIRNNYES